MAPQLWIIILCGATVMTLALGIRASFGLFLGPMSVDLGMSREAFAIAIASQNLLWGLVAPFAGAVADKQGPIKVCVVGGLVYVAGLLMAASGASVGIVQLGLTTVGIALGISGFSVVLGAVGRAAPPEHRSLALGIASAGGSFGQFAIVPVGQAFLTGYGWSMSLLLLAAISFAIVPLAYGLGERKIVPGMQQTLSEAIREASTHSGFWLLTAGFFVCGFQVTFVAVHLPAFIADKGLPSWLGAASLSLIGLFNIAGTLIAGWLGGRYRKKYVLSLLYLLRSLTFVLFLLAPVSETSVLVFGAALGFLWLGTVPLTSGLVAQIFGPAYMSMLYGTVFFSHQVGSFLGAWLGGRVFDATGSYDPIWWASVALGIAAAILHAPIADRPLVRAPAPAT
ncbi:MAG: MFS transporter [Alphaproteobacteria bacterium]|nr:MFS transporter [Alphaproteobacteria bacterium]